MSGRFILAVIICVVGAIALKGLRNDDVPKTSTARKQNASDQAFAVCRTLEKTGVVSGCDVSGSGRTIDVTVDMRGTEAIRACDGIADKIAGMDTRFRGDWKMQIFSPFSGDRALASCVLN